MKKNINISYEITKMEDLSEQERKLITASELAVLTSHAPYSKFHVGAALLLDNGEIVNGSNQENVSFPIGFCAERTAISAKVSVYPKSTIKSIAVSVMSETGKILPPVPPCGMCRQALLEEESNQDGDIKVYLSGNNKEIIVIDSIKDLLPFQFNDSIFS